MRPPSAAPPYEFAPEERPLFPGSPYSPHHPTLRRVGYGLVAVLMALIEVNDDVPTDSMPADTSIRSSSMTGW